MNRRPWARLPPLRLSIGQRLVLSFVGLVLLVLMMTLGLARWSFERGFLDYMNALEQERLERLGELLTRHYEDAGGSWSRLSPAAFGAMLQRVAPRSPVPRGEPRGAPGALSGGAPPRTATERRAEPTGSPADVGGRRPFRPGRPPPGPPTAFYDSEGRRLLGPDLDLSSAPPIRVQVRRGGQVIGELRSLPHRRFETPQATAFFRQQRNASLIIGALALAVTLGVAILLARALLRPLRRAIAGVDSLASGDYQTRLDDGRADEIGRLMAGLDHLAEMLEQSRSAQRRWLADISHELRTPVTILAGEIQALQDGVRRCDAAQLESFDQEVGRLRRLIEDLYTLSLADIGGLRYRFLATDLHEMLTKSVAAARQRATDAGILIALESSTPLWIKADEARLEQLIGNLIENAIAYTTAPGRIMIRLSREADQASLRVDDTPPGVPEDDLEQLFEPLYRRDAGRSRRVSGAGLGLAICRNIVAGHRGRIWAEPSPLGGLRIQVRLPLTKEDAECPAKRS